MYGVCTGAFFSILKAYWYEAQVTPQQLVHA